MILLPQGSGTSLATPLVSGACALIKQAHPEASAQNIRTAIMNTGIRRFTQQPDTAYGYGKIDAYQAALSLGTIIGTKRMWRDARHHLEIGIAANNGIVQPMIVYAIGDNGLFNNRIQLHLAADSLIYTADFPLLQKGLYIRYFILTLDGSDSATLSPRNAPDSLYEFYVGDTSIPFVSVKENTMQSGLSIFPNPAHSAIDVRTQTDEAVSYVITDALGREMLPYDAERNIHELKIRVDKFHAGAYELHAQSQSEIFEDHLNS